MLADVTPGRARTASGMTLPSSSPPGPSRPRPSIQARPLPRQLCRVNVGAGSPSDSALKPYRTGIAAMVRTVEATGPSDLAARAAVWSEAQTSADVACMPSATARSGDARTVPKVPNRRISGGGGAAGRGAAAGARLPARVGWRARDGLPRDRAGARLAGDLRGDAELVDLVGTAFTGVTDAIRAPSECPLF